MRRATDSVKCERDAAIFQSTLSLRRATCQAYEDTGLEPISIHALLAESDAVTCGYASFTAKFQSTLSLRRATRTASAGRCPPPYFNPRSPCGERPQPVRCPWHHRRISIHALLAESDICGAGPGGYPPDFNPRSPCGERRLVRLGGSTGRAISIHALLAESDAAGISQGLRLTRFQSTLSLRRATANTTKLALSFLSKVPI